MTASTLYIIFVLAYCCTLPSISFAFHILSSYHPRRPQSQQLFSASTTSTSVDVSTQSHPNLILEQIDDIIIDPFLANNKSPSFQPINILHNTNQNHEKDVRWAKASSLPFESDGNVVDNSIEYEIIQDPTKQSNIAIQTKQSTPLLDINEIQLLKHAVESYWNRPTSQEDVTEKSRFTYQRKGNSEAHLSDVVKYTRQQYQRNSNANFDMSHLVHELLLNRVYPWIREAYLSNEEEETNDELELYVYDSLFIRYNATEANNSADNNVPNNKHNNGDIIISGSQERKSVGAGQPLHRDLGYVSVNIMLNSQDEFDGGGTFFENQLVPMMMSTSSGNDQPYEVYPLKPIGPGHALAHYSNNRHAGAATLAGVRDILVIFLAATPKKNLSDDNTNNGAKMPPRWELNARIKSTARSYCSESFSSSDNVEEQLLCRILHHRLAIDQVMNDGEAWHYLGMALLDYHHNLQSYKNDNANGERSDGKSVLDLAISCLNEATRQTPCDGRLYNNLGIALERLLEYHYNIGSTQISMIEQLHVNISLAYQNAVLIHSTCERVGCEVGADYESACLNYGLYLSKLDKFDDAIDALSRIAVTKAATDEDGEQNELNAAAWARQRVLTDATNLLHFCTRQKGKK